MVRDDLIDVGFAAEFDIVASLMDVHSIESFNDTEIVECVLHIFLDLLTNGVSDFLGFGADEEVIHLSEY